MITIIIPYKDDITLLNSSLEKLNLSGLTPIRIIIPYITPAPYVENPLSYSAVKDTFSNLTEHMIIFDSKTDNLYEAFSKSLNYLETPYVLFALPGDCFSSKSLIDACSYYQRSKEPLAFITSKMKYTSPNISTDIFPPRKRQLPYPTTLSLKQYPSSIPNHFFGLVFKSEFVKEYGINASLKYDGGLMMLYQILSKSDKFGYIPNSKYLATYISPEETKSFSLHLEKDWYLHSLQNFLLPLEQFWIDTYNEVPLFIQYAIFYQLIWRFKYNANNGDKHIIDNEIDIFFSLCTQILKHISAAVIVNQINNPKYNTSATMRYAMFYLKNDLTLSRSFTNASKTVFMSVNDALVTNVGTQKVFIDLIDIINNELVIEAGIDTFIGVENLHLIAELNNIPLPIEETYRYAHSKFFSRSVHKRYTFRIKISLATLKEQKYHLNFYLQLNGMCMPLSIGTKTYMSRINVSVPSAYWMIAPDKMLCFHDSKTLCIQSISFKQRVIRELKCIKHLFTKKSRKLAFLRAMYWITLPSMKKKNIWLTYDKLYKGGDCGEYLYRYMCSQKSDSITPCYVINEDSPDYKRLRKEGFRPLKYGSLKHKLYYLNSSVVFTTHGGVHSFNAFSNSDISYFQDLLHHDVACIQHGLTVQQLAFNSNRLFNNMKRYYCASKYEIKNLSHPVYGYEDKSILKLTGIPRYDGLVNNDKKQILITPTWRNYIAMPAASKNSAKPYNPNFKYTDYFKIYNALLSDKRLIETAKATGYKIIYLLHPVISAQLEDYPIHPDIEIVQALGVNYEKILTESSLMLTDYSGVQFDFAYMRKPIIYYHPPKLPPHYKEGGFFYDTMGFGEIVTEHDDLVKLLCEYMENQCTVKSFYMERQNDFFAYSDLNSCKRIYEDMLEFQNGKK